MFVQKKETDMRRSRRNILTIVPLLALMLMVLSGFFSSATIAADVVIVANNSVSEAALTKGTLKKIYLGKQVKWSDGNKIYLTALKKSDTHKVFAKTYVRKSPSQFRMYWKKMVFTGKGKAPKSCESDAAMLKYVSSTDGAIGYISSGASPDGVKTITVSDN